MISAWMAQTTKGFIFLYISMALAGCVPYITSFPKIDAPNADYFHVGCQSELGPNSTVYYPFHGIYISIDLRASRFGLHIASSDVVELSDKTIAINGWIGTTPYHSTLDLVADSRSVGGGYEPAQFAKNISPYSSPDNFGPLEGFGSGKSLTWYRYSLRDSQNQSYIGELDKELTDGTIAIPAMTINGQHYESHALTFKRKTFVGLAALNC